jgi:ribosomal protein S28E/S33
MIRRNSFSGESPMDYIRKRLEVLETLVRVAMQGDTTTIACRVVDGPAYPRFVRLLVEDPLTGHQIVIAGLGENPLLPLVRDGYLAYGDGNIYELLAPSFELFEEHVPLLA